MFAGEPVDQPDLADELADYEPSEPSDDLVPDWSPVDPLPPPPLPPPSSPPPGSPIAINAVSEGKPAKDVSLMEGEDLPQDDEGLRRLIKELQDPVDQVVLRYVIPLRGKTGPEVSEALQQMILGINQRFPVKSVHHDPGTEFASTALSRWLAQHGVRVQHSLPTDKKGNGLSERTVGWVKSRVRTLLKSAELPVCWWPLAARWAASKHNSMILGEPTLPAFGQKVLHRVKRPSDGSKQLMERWIEARYGAPHRSIPDGHVLITSSGNLVASRGFKSGVIDPTKLKDLELPILQEEEALDEGPLDRFDEGGNPLRRLREKSSVRFLECLDFPTSEEEAHTFLLSQDYSISAIRQVLAAVVREEESTGDRRGIVEGRHIFGAYCHGGLRGVTNLSKRKPWTTRFLNRALTSRMALQPDSLKPSWSAVMLMRAGDVEVHRDWRNEWGTLNYTMHIPGEVQLWVEPVQHPSKGVRAPQPTWDPSETTSLTEVPCAFDPRKHHAVRMQPNWLLVGYTPLGTKKLDPRDMMYLETCEFPLSASGEVISEGSPKGTLHLSQPSGPECQVRAVSSTSEDTSESSIGSEELQRQIAAASTDDYIEDSCYESVTQQNPLEEDLQPDANTALIGWDFSNGDPGDTPHPGLVNVALADYLRVRGVADAYTRLSALGIESPNDLQFIYLEDLLESGFSRSVAERVMFGIHPPGTRRPDNPQLCSLTTGEVRVLDRAQRPIPWIIQNRTLAQRCPGPPLAGLGCKQPDAKRLFPGPEAEHEEDQRGPDPLAFPPTPGADPTDSPTPQSRSGLPGSSSDPPRAQHAAERAIEEYQYMMYMQSMWGDEEWTPGLSSSTSHVPAQASSSHEMPSSHDQPESDLGVLGPDSHLSRIDDAVTSDESSADPTDSSTPQSGSPYRCMAIHHSPAERTPGSQALSRSVWTPSAQVHAQSHASVHHARSGGLSTSQKGEPSSAMTAGIGVPTSDPLFTLRARGSHQPLRPAVRKVDENMYTPNVEELLQGLSGPLEVVHNVAPAEVRKHLQKWRPSAQSELQSFESMSVIRKFYGAEARALARDPSIEVIPGKAVCTVKPGDPFKRKFRVVSCGNFASTTAEGQLYAGGAGAESLRTLLVHASHHRRRCFGLDVKSAFLLAPIPAGVTKRYAMRPPRILIEMGLCTDDELWLIDRALYGFRESPKWWSLHRDEFLKSARWLSSRGEVRLEQFASEGNLWSMKLGDGSCLGHLLVYVDDMLLLTDLDVAESFITWLRQSWECTGLKEATSSDPLRFLGVDIYAEVDDKGEVVGYSLAQEAYIDELLRSHGVTPSSRATAPVPREWVRELPPAEDFSDEELRTAQRVTGELLWLAQRTRIDIGYCVGLMASWVSRYPQQVSRIGGRVLEYLANTKEYRLSLIPRRADGIRIYTDASFAPFGAHSISGIVLQYDECTVAWKSKRQSLVTLSTAESELCAGCEGVTLAQSLEALTRELDGSTGLKNLLVDNTAAVTIAEGGGRVRTRHLRVRAAFLQDMREREELAVTHCPGDVQLADCLTKALLRTRLEELSRLLGLGPPRSQQYVAAVSMIPKSPPNLLNDLQGPTPGVRPTVGEGSRQLGWEPDRVGLWLLAVIFLLQAELGDATSEEEEVNPEPLSLELSMMIALMTMSILFLWETGKHCMRTCCSRRSDDPRRSGGDHYVRAVTADDENDDDDTDGHRARRGRRQDAVRRAIERELGGEGLRQRGSTSGTSGLQPEASSGDPRFTSYVHVQLDSNPPHRPMDFEPPMLTFAASRGPQASSEIGFGGAQPSSSIPVPVDLPATQTSRPQADPSSSGFSQPRRVMSDASTQTVERSLTIQELCELQVVTTTGRGPGALHLFPNCHALRNVPSTHQRMFCRYCLQAAREGTGGGLPP